MAPAPAGAVPEGEPRTQSKRAAHARAVPESEASPEAASMGRAPSNRSSRWSARGDRGPRAVGFRPFSAGDQPTPSPRVLPYMGTKRYPKTSYEYGGLSPRP